jgi:ribosomal protein S27E
MTNSNRPPTNISNGKFINVTCPSCNKKVAVPDEAANARYDAGRNKSFYLMMAVVCGLYLVFPTLGIFEVIPDAIPIIGSLDEAAATGGLLYALTGLGWLPSFFRS